MDDPNNNADQKPRGRPAELQITEQLIKDAEALSGRGLTRKQVADYFGISERWLYAKMNEFPDLKLALTKGKAKTIALVAGKLIEQVKSGDTKAMMFYLKTQAGWRDVSTIVIEQDPSSDDDDDLKINTSDPNEASKIYQQIMLRGKK